MLQLCGELGPFVVLLFLVLQLAISFFWMRLFTISGLQLLAARVLFKTTDTSAAPNYRRTGSAKISSWCSEHLMGKLFIPKGDLKA